MPFCSGVAAAKVYGRQELVAPWLMNGFWLKIETQKWADKLFLCILKFSGCAGIYGELSSSAFDLNIAHHAHIWTGKMLQLQYYELKVRDTNIEGGIQEY